MNLQRYLIIVAALALAGGVGLAAAADVPGHISYQGMLQDRGAPYTGEANFKFALVDSLTGDYFWTNDGSQGPPASAIRIAVQDGLFSVLLGAAPMEPIDPSVVSNFTRDQALRIWVEFGSHGEVLLGNLPLSSVLFAHQAELARASAGDFAAAGEIWSQSGGFKFPDGTVQETAATSGGGDCLWSAGTGSSIYYNAGRVGIGTDQPTFPLSVEKSLGNNIIPMTLFRTTGEESAAAVRFQNALENHFNLGITGGSHLALGYNANIGLAGDVLRITPEGNVGLGRTNPAAKLDVNGSVRMTGLQLGTSATAGHVLTANASGVGTWQAAPAGGGESLWTAGTGGRIYYNDGHVGIGTETPLDKLHLGHIDDSSNFLRITATNNTGIRFSGESLYDGEIRYDRTDNSMRVYVRSSGSVPERMRITTDGNVGIGTSTPEARLHVNGAARMNGFQLGASATEGYVLTTDASGIGTWQPAPTGGGGDCHWISDNGYLYYNGGNVGIGTSTPNQRLTLGEAADNANYISLNSANLAGLLFYNSNANLAGRIVYEHSDNSMRLWADQGERMRITDGGDVGIGTTSPAARLHVNGTARMNGFQLGTSATAGHVLTADASGIGTWQPVQTGGGESLWSAGTGGRIYYNDGHVGIGTDTPQDKLHLGNIDDSSSFLRITATNNTGIRFAGDSAYDGEIRYDRTDNSMRVHVRSSGSVPERMRITTDGNVGIGTNTPEARLHVNGTAMMSGFRLGTSATAGHVLTANAIGVGTWQPAPEIGETHWVAGEGGSIYFDGGNVGIGNAAPTYRLEIGETADTWTYLRLNANEGSAVLFNDSGYSHMGGIFYNHTNHTMNFHTSMQDRMKISSEGNVGIGTGSSTPGQRLEIGNTNNYDNYIRLATHGTGKSGIQFWDGEDTYSGMLQYEHSDDSMRLMTRSGATAAERLRISSSGNVGIGTTTPSDRLHVNGNVRVNNTIHVNGFRLGTWATPGHVLTVNASGVGTWQAPTGGGAFTLPYEGTVSSDTDPAFKITNNNIHGTTVAALGDQGDAITATTSASEGIAVVAHNSYHNSYAWLAHDTRGIIAGTPRADAPAAEFKNTGGGDIIQARRAGNQLVFKVDNSGQTTVSVLHITGGSDLAEKFAVSTQAEPGMVVEIDPVNPGKLRIAEGAYNRRVAGVVSGANGIDTGMLLSSLPGETNTQPIALSGRVWVFCDASDKAIEPGDMLTTSSRPGHAMAVSDFSRAHGAVLGKAMTALAKGEKGMVLALVNLQ